MLHRDKIVFDEYPLKMSKWQHFKLWLRYHRYYKRITIWVKKGDEK